MKQMELMMMAQNNPAMMGMMGGMPPGMGGGMPGY